MNGREALGYKTKGQKIGKSGNQVQMLHIYILEYLQEVEVVLNGGEMK